MGLSIQDMLEFLKMLMEFGHRLAISLTELINPIGVDGVLIYPQTEILWQLVHGKVMEMEISRGRCVYLRILKVYGHKLDRISMVYNRDMDSASALLFLQTELF